MQLINILIRTSNRPDLFRRCLKSVTSQSYPNIRIIISYDNPSAVKYIPSALQSIFVTADRTLPYFYDCYCNDLKSLVDEGYFLFLDDDDFLLPESLSKIAFDSPAMLYQYQRGADTYPLSSDIRRGHVGMPCLILHHSLKSSAHIPGTGQGDYCWIKKISEQVPLKFHPEIIVAGDRRGYGKVHHFSQNLSASHS